MTLLVEQDGTLQLREVYNAIDLKSNEGELFSICMRDSGFEFEYQGTKYEAKDGVLQIVPKKVLKLVKEFEVETNEMLM